MDIEQVAHDTPEKILTMDIDPAAGYQAFHGRKIAFALGLEGKQVKQCVALVGNLYRMVVEKDMSMLEINPLVVTKDGDLTCLDGKMDFDSTPVPAPEIVELRDLEEEDPMEIEASKHDLAFIKLDGNIGCSSMAPAWRWRRSTSSSSTAANRPTSSMSAAAPERARDGGVQDHPQR